NVNRLTHCVIDVRDVGRMSYLPWILRWFIVFQLALGLPAFGSAIASQTTTHLFGGLCRTWPAATYYNGFYGRNGNGTVLPEAASDESSLTERSLTKRHTLCTRGKSGHANAPVKIYFVCLADSACLAGLPRTASRRLGSADSALAQPNRRDYDPISTGNRVRLS